MTSEGRAPSLLIAGGGTGGHVLAGVAVADAWRRRHGPEAPVVFVGAKGGIEEKLVPRAGYPLERLSLGSLNRVGLGRRLKTLIQLPLALLKSAVLLAKLKPSAVLGVGGYASGPVVLMARLTPGAGRIAAILEQNTVPGFTNRMLARFVRFVFAAFPGTEKRFPHNEVVCTGNPVRSILSRLPSARRDPFTIFAFGGSQGALGMNTLILEALPELLKAGPLRFIHQTGEKDFERVSEGYRKLGVPARVEKFIHDMRGAYSEATLVICRAGASTLGELAAVGRAAILVPLPTAADNHQEMNARIYVEAGAALVIAQGTSKGPELAVTVRKMIENPVELEKMESAVVRFHKPSAADEIVTLLSRP